MKVFLLFLCLTVAFASDEDIKNFVANSKLFTGAVYNEVLVDNNANILVSPFSLESALALIEAGAVGATAQQIRSSLFLPDTEEETEAEFKSVIDTLPVGKYTIHNVNKVYVENGVTIKDNFKKVATDVYKASFQNVEFVDNVDTAEEINQWVRDQTEDKIDGIVSPDDLDASTVVVLINALYFHANFSTPFTSLLTKKSPFYLSTDETVDSDMMVLEATPLKFYENLELDAKIVELPFQDPIASLTIVVPNKKEGIALLEKQTSAVLANPPYQQQLVEVHLPKYRIESTIDFIPILKRLGVRYAFAPGFADFSGLAGVGGQISINKITQKTFIDVNEMGVEAAAATDVGGITSVVPTPQQIVTADHPFFFYLKVKDIILFEGRVLSPQY